MGHTMYHTDQCRYEDQVDVAVRFYPVLMAIMRPWDELVNFGFILGQWEMASERQIVLNGNTRKFFVNLVVEANKTILDFLCRELFDHKNHINEKMFGELNSAIIGCYISLYQSSNNSRELSLRYREIYHKIMRGG